MQHEILLLVREHAVYHVDRGNISRRLLAHEEYHARHIVAEVQLAGLDINIARQDIIQNDILYEGSLVVLFVIQRLDIVDRNRNQRTDTARQFVLALYEYSVFQTRRTVTRCMISITAETNDLAGEAQLSDCFLPHFTDTRQIGTCYDRTACVNNADRTIHRILHLQNNRLEQSRSHFHHLSRLFHAPRRFTPHPFAETLTLYGVLTVNGDSAYDILHKNAKSSLYILSHYITCPRIFVQKTQKNL